jgi:hypothetical protein
MMTQTWALLVDAYRELHAKKMFWIVLILTALVIGGFSVLGVNDRTLTILWYQPMGDMPQARLVYKMVFSYLVVGFWLTWIAALLALISTSGIFPDFLSSGSIDLFLARPISRLRLFFTKYAAGLLFVTLQVTIFAVLSFLVLGIRGGLWEPGLFWSIPLVVLFFSYLFAISVLMGVWTRSTIAALLLTLLAWFGIFLLDYVDKQLTFLEQVTSMRYRELDRQVSSLDDLIARRQTQTQDSTQIQSLQSRRDVLAIERDGAVISPGVHTFHRVLFGIKSFVPKTRETIALLDRVLFRDKELQEASKHADEPAATQAESAADDFSTTGPSTYSSKDSAVTLQFESDRQRSIWWIVGTSLLFEAAVLGLAAWSFSRRDY